MQNVLLKSINPAARTSLPVTAQLSLADINPGKEGKVVGFGSLPQSQKAALQAYGLLPGRTFRVLQHAPVTVIMVEETELAFELEVARQVLVTSGS